MSLITCKYNNIKNYLTPTKSWLEPLEVFVPEEISSRGILIISEMIKKEKIMVKVTKGRNHNLEKINNLIKNLPNFVYTYCVIICRDSFLYR